MRYDRYVLFERYVRFEVCVLSPRYQSYLLQSVAALLSGAYSLCHLADEIGTKNLGQTKKQSHIYGGVLRTS